MKATSKVVKEITLTLSASEAVWLKGVVQNPIIEDEAPEDEQRRKELFHAIESALK